MITGCPTPQKGIVTYSLSANRQRPLAGTAHAAIFNTWRRFRHQVLYVVPPFVAAYAAMNWAVERYALRDQIKNTRFPLGTTNIGNWMD